MKANEAPEKLYVNSNDHLTYNGYYAFTNKMRACDIEYTRTDAFVKKACDYLSYYLDTSKIDVQYKFDFIEQFRKYMEGE